MLIVCGCMNVTAYFRNMSALEKTATAMGEIISRCTSVTTQDVKNFAVEAQAMVGGPPFSPLIDITGTGGAFIISVIGNDSGTSTTIVWQKQFSSAPAPFGSKLGTVGQIPVGLGTYALPKGQVMVAVELYNTFTLWGFGGPLLPAPTAQGMYTLSMFLARSASPAVLETLTQSDSAACGT